MLRALGSGGSLGSSEGWGVWRDWWQTCSLLVRAAVTRTQLKTAHCIGGAPSIPRGSRRQMALSEQLLCCRWPLVYPWRPLVPMAPVKEWCPLTLGNSMIHSLGRWNSHPSGSPVPLLTLHWSSPLQLGSSPLPLLCPHSTLNTYPRLGAESLSHILQNPHQHL